MPVRHCSLLLASVFLCPPVNANNLVVNPDFATDIAGWTGSGIAWDASNGDPAPGSLHLSLPGTVVTSTCIPIAGELRVALSANFRTTGSRAEAKAIRFTDTGCSIGGTLVGAVASTPLQQPPDFDLSWYAFTRTLALPADTQSVHIELSTQLTEGQMTVDSYFDGIAFGPVDDLVAHKSFEACWSDAQTIDGFAALVNAGVEGAAGCIPATVSACSASTCNAMPGCPITLRSGSTAYGATSSLLMRLDMAGSVDPLAMDMVSSGVSCTVSVNNTSNLVATYQAFFPVTHDGNFGFYAGAPYVVQNSVAYGLGSSDWTLSGSDFRCNKAFGLFNTTQIYDAIAAGVQSAASNVAEVALGKTICPLP